jgi:hypothetical protein
MSLLSSVPASMTPPGYSPFSGTSSHLPPEEGGAAGQQLDHSRGLGHVNEPGGGRAEYVSHHQGKWLSPSHDWDLGTPATWFNNGSHPHAISVAGLAGAAQSPGWRAGMRQEDLLRCAQVSRQSNQKNYSSLED